MKKKSKTTDSVDDIQKNILKLREENKRLRGVLRHWAKKLENKLIQIENDFDRELDRINKGDDNVT